MRVLIAEDDLASRKFLQKVLSKYGECDMVIDGVEALDAYLLSIKEDNPYDLICLDIMLPKVDGVEVLKAIRDFETHKKLPAAKRIKVIMTTALAQTQLVKEAFEIGCEAYIEKPIDPEKMIEVIRKMGLI